MDKDEAADIIENKGSCTLADKIERVSGATTPVPELAANPYYYRERARGVCE